MGGRYLGRPCWCRRWCRSRRPSCPAWSSPWPRGQGVWRGETLGGGRGEGSGGERGGERKRASVVEGGFFSGKSGLSLLTFIKFSSLSPPSRPWPPPMIASGQSSVTVIPPLVPHRLTSRSFYRWRCHRSSLSIPHPPPTDPPLESSIGGGVTITPHRRCPRKTKILASTMSPSPPPALNHHPRRQWRPCRRLTRPPHSVTISPPPLPLYLHCWG
jgi:hypothetical protein